MVSNRHRVVLKIIFVNAEEASPSWDISPRLPMLSQPLLVPQTTVRPKLVQRVNTRHRIHSRPRPQPKPQPNLGHRLRLCLSPDPSPIFSPSSSPDPSPSPRLIPGTSPRPSPSPIGSRKHEQWLNPSDPNTTYLNTTHLRVFTFFLNGVLDVST